MKDIESHRYSVISGTRYRITLFFFIIFYFFTDGLENGIVAQYPWGGYLFGILQDGVWITGFRECYGKTTSMG